MHAKLKRNLIIGVGTLAVAAGAGGAYAATQSGSNPRQAYLNDVAKRLNVTPQQLTTAMKNALIDQLNAAVKAGRLTQAQANQIEKRIQQGRGLPFFGPPGLHDFRMHGAGALGAKHAGLSAAASYLGLTRQQLLSDLRSGRTLAHIATSRGKSVSGLESAMTSAIKADLDKAVSAKRITSSQEHQILTMLSAHINDLVNGSLPRLGRHGLGPRGAFGPDGPPDGGGPPGAGLPPGAGGPPASFRGLDVPGANSGRIPNSGQIPAYGGGPKD
jgi:hypothetical protein